MTASTLDRVLDPGALTPSQWGSRLAALTHWGRGPDDPDVIACRAALSYWRCRRVIDREREMLAARDIPALADMLTHAAHPVTGR